MIVTIDKCSQSLDMLLKYQLSKLMNNNIYNNNTHWEQKRKKKRREKNCTNRNLKILQENFLWVTIKISVECQFYHDYEIIVLKKYMILKSLIKII